MAFFLYKARDSMGKLNEGYIEADALKDAVVKLQQTGLLIIDIKYSKKPLESKKRTNLFSSKRVKLKDLALFCRQLSFMLEAGVSLLSGLQIIIENEPSPGIENLAHGLNKMLRSGHSLGEACAEFSKELPLLMVNMVTAGEVGGFLDSALERLANYFDKEIQTKEKVKTAMVYPIIVLFIAVLAISAIFTFVVPVFASILENMSVPIPIGTKIVLYISLIFRNYWYLLLGGILFLIFVLFIFFKTPEGKKNIDDLLFKIPIVKDLAQKVIVTRFCRTLANLLQSGLPILQALEVVGKNINNTRLKMEIDKAQKNIRDGLTLTDSFKESKVIPPMVIQMMAVGEQSGNLDRLLVKISDFYDVEVTEATDRLPKLIEPIMLVVLGIIVGSIVMGVLLPMFSVMSNIGT